MPGANQETSTPDQLDYDAEQEQLQGQAQSPGSGASPSSADAVAVQREASSKGWVSQDKYTGDPAKWVDAATFVDRGNKFNTTLQHKVSNLEAQLNRFKGTADAFKKFHDESMAAKQTELTTALSQLKREHREAIRDGDDDAADLIEGRMDVIVQEKAKVAAVVVAEPPAGPPPEMGEWLADGNDWFNTDTKLQTYATALAKELVDNGETLRGRPFLDKVTAMMKEAFPTNPKLGGNPNRTRAGSSESGSSGSAAGGASAKSERNLPAEDRKLMNEFVAAGWTTKEKFLSEYRW